MHVAIEVQNFEIASRPILGLPNIIRQVKSLLNLGVRQITISNWEDRKFRTLFKKFGLIHKVHPSIAIPDNVDIILPSHYFLHHNLIENLLSHPEKDTIGRLTQFDGRLWQYLVDDDYSFKTSEQLFLKSISHDLLKYFPNFILKIWIYLLGIFKLSFGKTIFFDFFFLLTGMVFLIKPIYHLDKVFFLLAFILHLSSQMVREVALSMIKKSDVYFISKWIVLYLFIGLFISDIFQIYGRVSLMIVFSILLIFFLIRNKINKVFLQKFFGKEFLLYIFLINMIITDQIILFFWGQTLLFLILILVGVFFIFRNLVKKI